MKKGYTNKELKLTAALYASREWILEYLRENGRLPDEIPTGGMHIGMRVIIERRGTDITLTDKEKLIYDALIREKRLPGGGVRLIEDIDIDEE